MSEPGTVLAPAVGSALDAFARSLREEYGEDLVRVRLFGSVARGEASDDSDVDVAVVLATADWQRRRDVIDLATDLGMVHDVYLSPTIFDQATFARWTEQERALVRDIEREGLEL